VSWWPGRGMRKTRRFVSPTLSPIGEKTKCAGKHPARATRRLSERRSGRPQCGVLEGLGRFQLRKIAQMKICQSLPRWQDLSVGPWPAATTRTVPICFLHDIPHSWRNENGRKTSHFAWGRQKRRTCLWWPRQPGSHHYHWYKASDSDDGGKHHTWLGEAKK
jgi:hypothetical protein